MKNINKSNTNVVFISLIAANGGLLFEFNTGIISVALPFLRVANGWALSNSLTE